MTPTLSPHILMVDDDPDDLLLARDAFFQCGASDQVGFAESGAELLEMLHGLAQRRSLPRLVLLDWNMPRKTGLETLREIKADPELRQLAVVVFTTSRDSADVAAANDAGAAGFMTKPVTFEGLSHFVQEIVQRYCPTDEEDPVRQAAGGGRMDPVRVLVVDDDEEDFLIARDLLADSPSNTQYQTEWASSGKSARARMVPDGGRPPAHDICLLDFRLGAESGVQLLSEVRQRGYTHPVILMTGSDSRSIDERALSAGASDYLVKGRIDAAGLERAIRYAIAQKTAEEALRTSAQALREARHREAEVGAAVQRMLLLREPPPQFSHGIAVGMHLAGADRITGDYTDFLVFHDRCFDVVIGDIMGKGIAAALVAAAVKSHLQRVARQLAADLNPFGRLPEPQEIVGALDATMNQDLVALESFVTLAYARFDLERRRLVLVDAGHPSVLYLPAGDGEPRFLHGDNLPLGIAPAEFYVQQSLDLSPGDRFVFYSDGLTEAAGASGEPYGPERLADLARTFSARNTPPQEMTDLICGIVNAWRSGSGDDLTCLVIEVLPDIDTRERPLRLRRWLEVESAPSQLETIRAFAERFCGDAALGEALTDTVVLGLSEAAGNIIEHAYQNRGDQHVRLEMAAYDDQLTLRLHDRGRPFQPDAIPGPTLDGTSERGYGWFLIQQCFDEIRFRRDELGYNHLRLTRQLNQDPDKD